MLKTKADMEIWGINTVNKYKIKAFVTKENKPKVRRLKGSVIMLRRGLRKNDKTDKTIPAIINVVKPPVILTPESICDATKREKAFIADLVIRDFIIFILPNRGKPVKPGLR